MSTAGDEWTVVISDIEAQHLKNAVQWFILGYTNIVFYSTSKLTWVLILIQGKLQLAKYLRAFTVTTNLLFVHKISKIFCFSGVARSTMKEWNMWFVALLVIIICIMTDVAIRLFTKLVWPTYTDKVQ